MDSESRYSVGASILIGNSADISHLIVRAADNDRAAYRELYASTHGKMLKTAIEIVRDRESAHDVVQEAFLKIWTRAGQYQRSEFSPISWLVAIVRNQALDHLRKRRLINVDLNQAAMVVDTGIGPEQLAIRSNMAAFVRRHIAALKADRREMFSAIFDGLSYDQAATKFDVPISTVKNRMHQAINELRRTLPHGLGEN